MGKCEEHLSDCGWARVLLLEARGLTANELLHLPLPLLLLTRLVNKPPPPPPPRSHLDTSCVEKAGAGCAGRGLEVWCAGGIHDDMMMVRWIY